MPKSKSVTFTEESHALMSSFAEQLGFATVSAFVQAAVVAYVKELLPVIKHITEKGN